ncbi:DUF389 domain-containing protein [Aurantibacter sp.]|uniref:DUF389 domain-containing protein n=1 Tax=Aurantibacter sp. TaxID=2807103 RepID=UPI0035C87D35
MEENKFNFSEDTPKEDLVQESKDAVKKDAVGLFASFRIYLRELLDFRDDTDRDATVEAIKADIPLKGATAWILICSIFVASIGLNANSTAVVIGAMLISPLMGPILGLGMSLAINDIDTLKKSLINLTTMIVLSLLTAFLFFKFFPLSEETSELLGRTRPDIRDVLIAFFGGAALMIARTKKGTIASVIFGVAIATALMPPLCTAGFGLAKNMKYFWGAMYLFTINTIFIGLAAFVVLKVLRFPMLKYANSKKRKRIAQLASLVAVIVMIPAIRTFYNVWTETKYEMGFKNFVKNEVESNDDLWSQRDPVLDQDTKKIKLYFNGEISPAMENSLRNSYKNYENIQGFDLVINSNKSRSADVVAEMLKKSEIRNEQKDILVTGLQQQVDSLELFIKSLKSSEINMLDYKEVARDAKIKFNDLKSFGYATMFESKDFVKMDTISIAKITWNSQLSDSVKTIKDETLKLWLKDRIKAKKVVIKSE